MQRVYTWRTPAGISLIVMAPQMLYLNEEMRKHFFFFFFIEVKSCQQTFDLIHLKTLFRTSFVRDCLQIILKFSKKQIGKNLAKNWLKFGSEVCNTWKQIMFYNRPKPHFKRFFFQMMYRRKGNVILIKRIGLLLKKTFNTTTLNLYLVSGTDLAGTSNGVLV